MDPDTQARIDAYAERVVASWPPLTAEQVGRVSRILRGEVVQPLARPSPPPMEYWKVQVVFGRVDVSDLTPETLGRTFTYLTDLDVHLGDVVILPGTWVNPEEQEGTVVALTSAYEGELSHVLRLAE